jgi:hypothetical protein
LITDRTIIRVFESYSTTFRATGIAHFSSSNTSLKRGILMIKYFSKKSYRWSILGLLLVLLLSGCTLTKPRSGESKKQGNAPFIPAVTSQIPANKGIDPGPKQQKPLSLSDLEVGGVRIGGSIEEVVKQYGQPSEKTVAHGIGSPYWIFKNQGLTVDFDGPIWGIAIMAPFKGGTPRGIHIGSSTDEVMKAYPDMIKGELYFQKSTDGQFTLQLAIIEGKVTQIWITQDLTFE